MYRVVRAPPATRRQTSFSLFLFLSPAEISMPTRRVHPKSGETHQDASGNPRERVTSSAWPRTIPFSVADGRHRAANFFLRVATRLNSNANAVCRSLTCNAFLPWKMAKAQSERAVPWPRSGGGTKFRKWRPTRPRSTWGKGFHVSLRGMRILNEN